MLICLSLTPMFAYADTTERHTDVMSDLMKDESFDVSEYPSVAKDNSLSVIQIAEGTDKSLLIYVYNPSGDRVATKIRMSVGLGKDIAPKDYNLKELSHKGTLSKYVVENFKISDDNVRYYDLVSIYRAWDKNVDEPSGNDNTISQVVYKIAKNYTVKDVAGGIEYVCNNIDVVEITKKWCGSVRYNDGFHLYTKKCDSWFVAFDTDIRIDNLIEAEVIFDTRSVTAAGNNFTDTKYDKVENGSQKETPKAKDVVQNDADGLFAKKYIWNRIERSTDFIKKEQLTETAKSEVEKTKWVLRFYESDYIYTWFGDVGGNWASNYEEVYNVSILRLSFETLGDSYNLGVVDNYQSPDGTPDNTNQNETEDPLSKLIREIKEWWEEQKELIKIILSVLFVAIILIIFAPLVPYVIKAVIFVIALPFKLVKRIVEAFRKKKE